LISGQISQNTLEIVNNIMEGIIPGERNKQSDGSRPMNER
jgi:hypothetical protein